METGFAPHAARAATRSDVERVVLTAHTVKGTR